MNLLYNKANLLSFFWNYSLFKENFENLINNPEYSLLYLSMIKKKRVRTLQNILFLTFRKKRLNLLFNKSSIFFKKSEDKPFLFNIQTLLLNKMFMQSIELYLQKIFSFVPFKFRSTLTSINKALTLKFPSVQTFYTISFEITTQTSNILKKIFSFVKKIFINKESIIYCFKFFKFFVRLKNREQFFRFFFQIDHFLNNLYYSQIDCYLYYIASQSSLNFNSIYGRNINRLKLLVKEALQLSKIYFSFDFQQRFSKLKKKRKKNISIKYVRIHKNVLIFFSGSLFQFFCYKKQIFFFLATIFQLSSAFYIDHFDLLGFRFSIICNFFKTQSKKLKSQTLVKFNFKKLAPIVILKKIFVLLGLLNYCKSPKNFKKILNFLTFDILNWYISLLYGLQSYYFCALNTKCLNLNIYYILKWSLVYTLVKKHKKTVSFIFIKYLKSIKFFLKFIFKKFKSSKAFETFFFKSHYFFNYSF